MSRVDLVLGMAIVACMAFADIERTASPVVATVVSMLGWTLFLAQLLWWARGEGAWATLWSRLARIALLALASLAVLSAYYAHSHVLEAGVHVDMVYTYVGLEWFLDLQTPITFAAKTFSYPQFPSMVLGHLPGVIVGFDRLGPLAVQFGLMVSVALLLAVVTEWAVSGRLPLALATVVVASAVFSNRLLVLTYNTIGYAPPAICLGLMFVAAVLARNARAADRIIGLLLVASLLHFYTGFLIVLPICAAWLVVTRHPVTRVREFVRSNPVLVTVLAMFLVTLAINPDLLVRRIVHVTTDASAPSFVDHIRQRWRDAALVLRGNADHFLRHNPGSWLLLDLPPLGGWQLPILAVLWGASFLAVPGRRIRFVVTLVGLAVLLAVATLAQHLTADFMEYRDFTLVYALMTTGLFLVFGALGLRGRAAIAAWVIVVAIGIHNWSDVARLRGHRFNGGDYAPVSEDLLARLTAVVRTPNFRVLGVTRLDVVLDDFVAVHWLYDDSYRRAGLIFKAIPASEYCVDPAGAIARATADTCEAFVFVTHARSCERFMSAPTDGAPIMRVRMFDSVCRAPDGVTREPRLVSLEDGG